MSGRIKRKWNDGLKLGKDKREDCGGLFYWKRKRMFSSIGRYTYKKMDFCRSFVYNISVHF